jgi:hypothetical protein
MKTEVRTGVGAGEGSGEPHGGWQKAMTEMWGNDDQGRPIWKFIVEGNKDIPGIPLDMWEIRGKMGVEGRWTVTGVFLHTGEDGKLRTMTGILNSRCGNGNPNVKDRKFPNVGYTIYADKGVDYRMVEPKTEPKTPAQIAEEKLKERAEEVRLLKEKLEKLEKQVASEPKPTAQAASTNGRPAALPTGAAARLARAKAEQEAKEKAEREAREARENEENPF